LIAGPGVSAASFEELHGLEEEGRRTVAPGRFSGEGRNAFVEKRPVDFGKFRK
jgi:1,4-dihydroxy-2-naphthoyl-CoA synthase